MHEVRVLIAAAGRGSRAGLPYPKTLYPVMGVPILLRIVTLVASYDSSPTVVVSPSGEKPILDCLSRAGVNAHLVLQPEPLGMGDAVLRFASSPTFDKAEHVLLIWGDIPLIQPETLVGLLRTHFEHGNDLTFSTRYVDSAYTLVSRDSGGRVVGLVETREQDIYETQAGERDIGLFVFRKAPIFNLLQDDLPGRLGQTTGEHGFLYVIAHLVSQGLRVEAIQNATELDLVSLNKLSDLNEFLIRDNPINE